MLRTLLTGLLVATFTLYMGCDDADETPTPTDPVTPEVTTPDTPAPLLPVGISEDPNDPGWLNFTTEAFTVEPGEERFLCFTTSLDAAVDIDAFDFISKPVVHHLVLAETFGGEADGMTECDVLFRMSWVPLFIAGATSNLLELPAGAGYGVDTGAKMLIQLHLLNYQTEAVTEQVTMRLRKTTAEDPTPVGIMAFGSMNVFLPPLQASEVTGSCTVGAPMDIFAVLPHMHTLGTSLRVEVGPDEENMTEVYVRDPYDFDDQSMEPMDLRFETGDKVKVTCGFNNTFDEMVTFGESTTNEMCFFIAYLEDTNVPLNGCFDDDSGDGGGGSEGDMSNCGTAPPNELGIGAMCTAEGGECAEGLTCLADLYDTGGDSFCMSMGACDSSADCGEGAECISPAQASFMNICVPEDCIFPGSTIHE